MCSSKISLLIKNLHSLTLPTTLWAVHVDPEREFLAILHVNPNSAQVVIDKGVLVSSENATLKTTVSLNGDIVHVPSITSKIDTISDLIALVYSLHDIKFCLNSSSDTAKCSKYVLNKESDLCEFCAFEALSQNLEEPPKPDEKKFLCTICGKTFNQGLEQHMSIHAPPDDKPFKCKVCSKGFAKKYNLNVHTRVHSGEKPYVCSKCGKTYSTRSNLATHMNSTHLEGKKHRCELCEMSFVHPRVLRIHMRKHTGEKPYMCQVCGKFFAKNVHLTIHMRTHTGEKPYICGICGRGFTTTGNLNSHKKINHNRTEWDYVQKKVDLKRNNLL